MSHRHKTADRSTVQPGAAATLTDLSDPLSVIQLSTHFSSFPAKPTMTALLCRCLPALEPPGQQPSLFHCILEKAESRAGTISIPKNPAGQPERGSRTIFKAPVSMAVLSHCPRPAKPPQHGEQGSCQQLCFHIQSPSEHHSDQPSPTNA